MGDPASIGPEITVKALADQSIYEACRPIVVGDACVLEAALRTSTEMTEITIDRNPNFIIPNWNFQGTCLGIDARLVVEKGITPVINTGIAHKVAGYGQIGAGTVHPPIACFEKAIAAYAKKLGFSLD